MPRSHTRTALHRRLRPHDLLHTATPLSITSGAGVQLVQKTLGHEAATMAPDLHGYLFPDRLDDVADRMYSAVRAPHVPRK